ncbi:glycosyltransferase [Exiguobacterium oxidotolerans]|uniref:glycosyltransferase n=1 Tax=Exiguobacterium oxidotolerans TaxID=223958 RepID=UPI0004947B59|nr:glycosyltransferase [Exiguobacterium oxidotolerans]
MDNIKNIAILIPCLAKGGAERAAGLLSKYLTKDFNVFLILLDSKEIVYDYSGEIVYLESEENFKKSNFKNKLLFFSKKYKKIKKLEKIKKELEIDLTISFLETPNIINLLTKTGDKKIVSVRSTRSLQTEKIISRIENIFIKFLYKNADKIISISEGVKTDLVNHFHINRNLIQTIYNFYDFDQIKKLKEDKLNDEMEIFFHKSEVIINVGRLITAKKQASIIEGFSQVHLNNPNTKLLILGDGPLRLELQKKINDLDLDSVIKILPFDNNPFKYISKAKVFILNSEREGFANVIIESMVCKTAVISVDCLSGPREILAGLDDYEKEINDIMLTDRGVLFPRTSKKGREEAFYIQKSIELLLNDNELVSNIEKNATEYIKNYNDDAIYLQWKKVFKEI